MSPWCLRLPTGTAMHKEALKSAGGTVGAANKPTKKPAKEEPEKKSYLSRRTRAPVAATTTPSAPNLQRSSPFSRPPPPKFDSKPAASVKAARGVHANSYTPKKVDVKDNYRRWNDLSSRNKGNLSSEKQPKSVSKSATSLNNNNEVKIHGKLKRPATVVDPSSYNVTLRRGQSSKVEQQQGQIATANQAPSGGDLSRASSVTNLNADKNNKGALSKVRKSASRDRLDKLTEKKNDRKAVLKNNNKIESDEQQQHNSYSTDSLQEIDFLQRQLQEMANEKSNLALQLGEQKGQLNVLRNEIAKLKMIHEQSSLQLEQLNDENTALRNRLRDVAHSPLSDNEKQQLLDSHRHHNSAPASIATNLLDDTNGGDITACPTPDWDKHSSSNVSEVSVACLQDKINQMQETHYSTNEELQATLQELTDLQRQLTELQQDNERLLEEKNLMFDSLCRQTERLNDTRSEVESLKQLLYRDKDDTGQFESIVEREQKLVDLLKSAQEERESLLLKQEQLNNELQEIRSINIEQANEIVQLTERVKTLESTLDAKHAEHKQLDQELAVAKDQSSGRQIEINRLTDLLDNARTKINELEQDRALSDKSELDEMLDNARKEKDALESEVAHLKEQVARSRNETEKLKEQVSILQEECKVTRNNAICTQSELEYKCEKLAAEKTNISEQLQQLQEAANELQVQAQCQLEDKRQLSSVLSETQRNLSEAERRNAELENEITDIKRLRREENEEWEKFQNDLLTSVRVANDFKTEAQQDLQKMIMENKAHRERVKQLEAQLDKLKVTSDTVTLRPSSFPGDDMAARRQKVVLSRQNSRQSVKSLIESIENAGKPVTKTGLSTCSRSSSTSSINSLASDARTPSSPSSIIGPPSLSPGSPLRTPSDWSESVSLMGPPKTPLREQQPNKQQSRDWNKPVITDSLSKSDMIKNNMKSEDRIQSAKAIDFNRRNSYSDLSERKDPLNGLVKNGGSKRNALLKWCQNKTVGYRNIDITNFSSSWNDGLALCALLHTYLPERVPYDSLTQQEKRRNFSLAFAAAESVGIPTTLNINDMIQLERPDWQQVMAYVTAIYKHFETFREEITD